MKNARKFFFPAIVIILLLASFLLLAARLSSRRPFVLNYDADYYWAETSYQDSVWYYEKLIAGFEYFLYLPPEYRDDRHNTEAKLPMVVTFHGSCAKYESIGKFGRMFLDPKIQNIKKCAVLVLYARGDYFSDCHDVSLLIQNLLLRNECIDRKCVIGFGHSQGAEFVVKLACAEPGLFKAVISGSGYYNPTFRELLGILPVRFYWKISKYDKGIYEQGYKAGRLLKRFCKDSVNVELESREHCWVELDDVVPDSGRTFLDWYKSAVTSP